MPIFNRILCVVLFASMCSFGNTKSVPLVLLDRENAPLIAAVDMSKVKLYIDQDVENLVSNVTESMRNQIIKLVEEGVQKELAEIKSKINFLDTKQNDVGTSYVRWGRKTCPANVTLVYSGQAGGGNYNSKGATVDIVCIPGKDVDVGAPYSYANDQFVGAEYESSGSTRPNGWPRNLHQKEIPCAFCYVEGRTTNVVIPGRKRCYDGWKKEYNGLLMSSLYTEQAKGYICVDDAPEAFDARSNNDDHMTLFPVRAKCGSLRCPPFIDKMDVNCVVCTK